MIIVATALQGWWDAAQMLFAFGVPALLVWWLETKRATVAHKREKAGASFADTGLLASQETKETSAWCQLAHPWTNEKLGVFEKRPTRIQVKGAGAITNEQAVAYIGAIRSHAIQPRRHGVPEDDDTDGNRKTSILRAQVLAKITLGWENIERHGRPYPFNRENAVKLYAESTWIADQVYAFFEALWSSQPVASAKVATGETPAPAGGETQKRGERKQARNKQFSGTLTPRKGGWVPASKSVTVAGRDIGGMVYVGTPPRLNNYGYHSKCRAFVDPSLSVAQKGTDKAADGMPYWAGYSDISPQRRATYLNWLASGRSDVSYNPGYMFIYFYGLERRFFVDQSEADAGDIVNEVRRLYLLYRENHSVRRYLGEFLDIAMLSVTEFDALEPTFERHGWDLPLLLKYAIGVRLDIGVRLTADWLLSWFICHPESKLRTAAIRCREEFLALFRLKFDKRFPEGLRVNKPRKTLKATYRAASSEFEAAINPTIDGRPISDISGLRRPISFAQEIADDAMNDLDKLSRFLGRNPNGRRSVEAHALLPVELWEVFPSEELEDLKAWAAEIVVDGGIVSLANAIERIEGERPHKIGRRQLTAVADVLGRIGFGLAPDPRFALRSPKLEEPVVIFDLGESVERLEEVSECYRKALIELALGTFVAHADGRISELETRVLEEQVSSVDGLSHQERQRLRANLNWYLAVPPDMSLLRRKVKEIEKDGQATMRAVLVAAAHADGMIQSEEVASIERVYKALGLDPSLAYSDLHAGDIVDEPRTVRAARSGRPGEPIPDPENTADPELDASRIAAIRSDTERVSLLLGRIFDPRDEQEGTGTSRMPDLLPGLDRKHAALVGDLVKQQRWTEEGFEQLCARHALLAAGALEAVNEWAFQTYEEAILDEYDGYEIVPEIAESVRTLLEGGSRDVQTETT